MSFLDFLKQLFGFGDTSANSQPDTAPLLAGAMARNILTKDSKANT